MSGIEFINRIDTVSKEFGLTRSDIGEKLGISKTTMSSWKSKNILPVADTALTIAYELGVSSDWLINGSKYSEVEEPYIIQQRQEIRNNIYNLASKMRKSSIIWDKTVKDGLEEDYLNCHTEVIRHAVPYISYRRLYNWAKCRYEIDYLLFEKLAKALNVSVGELLLIKDSSLNYNFSDNALYEKAQTYKETLLMLDSLTSKNREKIESILKDTYKLQKLESDK